MTNQIDKTTYNSDPQFANYRMAGVTYEDYVKIALYTTSTFNITGGLKLHNNNSIHGFGYNSNPISNPKTQKEALFEKLANIKDPEIRKQVEQGLLNYTSPSQAFVDMLIARHDKKKAEFEDAWAEYQISKDNLAFYREIFEILENKYENTESNYEAGLVRRAKSNYTNAEILTDLLLDKASDIVT